MLTFLVIIGAVSIFRTTGPRCQADRSLKDQAEGSKLKIPNSRIKPQGAGGRFDRNGGEVLIRRGRQPKKSFFLYSDYLAVLDKVKHEKREMARKGL
jgi:hypothetical protein